MRKTLLYLLIHGCSLICLLGAAHEARLAGHPCYTAWVVDEWMQVQNVGGIILTGDDRNTMTETCASAALFTTNITLTDLESNPGPRALMPPNDGLRNRAIFERQQPMQRCGCVRDTVTSFRNTSLSFFLSLSLSLFFFFFFFHEYVLEAGIL